MMKRFALFLAVLPLISLQTPSAKAASQGSSTIYFDETFLPVFVNRNDTGSITTSPGVATESGLGYDSRSTLGLVLGHSLLVGATYNTYNLKTKRDNVVGGDSGLEETTQRTQWGPTVGWLGSYWRFLFTYFVDGKKQVDTKNFDATGTTGDGSISNSKMQGYQILLGLDFGLSPHFSLGPSLVYRSLTYAKQSKTNRLNAVEDYTDTDLYSKHVENTLDAMLSLSFHF